MLTYNETGKQRKAIQAVLTNHIDIVCVTHTGLITHFAGLLSYTLWISTLVTNTQLVHSITE